MARYQARDAGRPPGQKPMVNWDVIDKELDRVGYDYKQPRFYSLKHVVEILSAVDPQRLVQDLREQQDRLETLVDFVVQGYHGGFAKSIQNYSQILQLFNESKEQVDALRKCLSDTSRHLSAQSRQMHTQWKKGIQLSTSLKMLDDIQAVVEVPDKISEALAGKDWPVAVQQLLKGCSKLAHEDLMKVGALRKLRAEMSSLAKVIQTQILDEITSQVYFVDTGQKDDSSGSEAAVQLPSITNIKLVDIPGMAAAVQSAGSSRMLNQGTQSKKEQSPTLDSTKTVGLHQLVNCLVQIGALGEAKAHLTMNTRTEVRSMIMRALESVPLSEEPLSSSSSSATIPKHVQAAAQKVVSKVFGCCLQALRNMGEVLQRIGTAPANFNSAALEVLMGEQTSFTSKTTPTKNKTDKPGGGGLDGMSYVEAELKQFWHVMQEELQALIAEMLLVPQTKLPSSSSTGTSVSSSTSWLGDISELSKKTLAPKTGESRPATAIEQAFRLMPVEGIDIRDPLQKTVLGTDDIVANYRRLLQQRLGGEGSPYLTPTLYVPVSQFVEKAQGVINHALGGEEGGEGWDKVRRGLFKRLEGGSMWLKQYVEDFVVGTFLPQAWVDLRARCTKALEQEDAFKAQVGFTGTPSKDTQQPIMPAARFTEEIITDISSWVTAMPFFASNLVGVVENILGRVFEAFTQSMQGVIGNSRAGRLASRTDISTIMATEVDAYLLGSLVMFYMPKSSDNFDAQAFVAAIRSQGVGEADLAESEILQFIFRERPSAVDQLLSSGSSHKLVTLAILSESLEYVANAIARLAGSKGPLTQPDTPSSRSSARSTNSLMLESMEIQVDKYRSLSGQCIRTVRLEMLLLATFHLHSLVMDSHLCEESDLKELHPCVGALTRTLARLTEECTPCLSYTKRQYVFGCMANASVKTIMWILPEIQEINGLGVERMVRVLSVLQPVLGGLGLGPGEVPRPETTRVFDKARAYYSMLALPVEEMLRIAAEKPLRYSAIEWAALLQVNVPGRLLFDSHYAQLQKIMDKAYGQSAGQKVVAAFEQVKTRLQVPTEQLRVATESITSGLQSSAQQIGEFFKLTRRGR